MTRAELGEEAWGQDRYTLEVTSFHVYAFQFGLFTQVVEGDRAGLRVSEFVDRDPDTGGVRKGSKLWDIAQACLPGMPWVVDLHQKAPLREEKNELVGQRFTAKIFVNQYGSNSVRHRTVRPWTPYGSGERATFIEDVMRDIERL